MHPTVAWLYGLQHFGIKLGLDNIRGVLDLLGHPERACPAIHVAGTNGKGSVAAMLDAMLGASGLATGLFTSPHLVRPEERVRIAGDDVAPERLHELLARLRARIEAGIEAGSLAAHPSFFEVITATALVAFAEAGVDAAVLEVGLGGRLDATNAVDAEVGAIVSIGLDHVETLGPTIERIAAEKAGIVKPGMTLVSGVTQQRAIDVVRRACRDAGATFVDARSTVRFVAEDGTGVTLETARGRYPGLRVALAGRHQIDNARVALAALEAFADRRGRAVDPAAVRAGLGAVRWPGRMQWLDPGDGGPPLLLDGAHNLPGIRALAVALDAALVAGGRGRPVLLFGATSGRDPGELLEPLRGRVAGAVVTRPPVDRGLDPGPVAAAAAGLGDVEVEVDPGRGLARARERAGAGGFVLVAGSLYLVGDVLGRLTASDVPGPVPL